MSLGQPTPSALSTEDTEGAVLGYPKHLRIRRVMLPSLHHLLKCVYTEK